MLFDERRPLRGKQASYVFNVTEGVEEGGVYFNTSTYLGNLVSW